MWMTCIIPLQSNVVLGSLGSRRSCRWRTCSTPPHGDSQMAVPPPAGQCAPPQWKNSSGMNWGTWQRLQGVDLASEFPKSQSDWASLGRAGTSQIHGPVGSTLQPTGHKGSTANPLVPDRHRATKTPCVQASKGQSPTDPIDLFSFVDTECLLTSNRDDFYDFSPKVKFGFPVFWSKLRSYSKPNWVVLS